MKLVECAFNISEGKDKSIITCIEKAISCNAYLAAVNMDPDHNRTVLTFIATPEKIVVAAYEAAKLAKEHIDMRSHKGQHPRIGAVDVIPILPLNDVSLEECVDISKKIAEKIGNNLNIPVYLYGASSNTLKDVAQIRKGGYEGLAKKLNDPCFKPDYGPDKYDDEIAKSGATIVGAEHKYIAYNVLLSTDDIALAKSISRTIRQSSGGMPKVQALGMMMTSKGLAQVSMNLLDYKVTGMHQVYENIYDLASGNVLESEIIGIIPKDALILAGISYDSQLRKKYEDILKQDNDIPDNLEKQIIGKAIERLKLKGFDPQKRIIEYIVSKLKF